MSKVKRIFIFLLIGFNGFAQWTVPLEVPNTSIASMAVYNGSLYVSGGFQTKTKYNGYNGSNMAGIGRFNGTTFDSVSTGLNGQGGPIIVYNNKLIVAGSFSKAGGIATNNIATWDGIKFDSIPGGITGTWISCLAVYHNELYVAGNFTLAGGQSVKNIAKWNGAVWSGVGGGLNNQVWCMEVFNDELYASGFIDTAGTIPVKNIARWNGIKWDSVECGLNGPAGSLKVYKNELYASSQACGVSSNYICKWNGTIWGNVGAGLTGSSSNVVTGSAGLEVYNNYLIVCGQFDKADTVKAFNIAKWDGTKWGKLGLGTEINYGWGENTTISYPYKNDLYVSGLINKLANDTCYFFARYHDVTIGIQEYDLINSSFIAYPNPTHDDINLSLDQHFMGGSIQLFDVIGKLIQTQPIKNISEKINFNLNSGIYFIKATTKDGVSKTEKLVVD